MTAIFADGDVLTHTYTRAAEPTMVPVFGHVQVVGLGMARRLSQRIEPKAADRVSSPTL